MAHRSVGAARFLILRCLAVLTSRLCAYSVGVSSRAEHKSRTRTTPSPKPLRPGTRGALNSREESRRVKVTLKSRQRLCAPARPAGAVTYFISSDRPRTAFQTTASDHTKRPKRQADNSTRAPPPNPPAPPPVQSTSPHTTAPGASLPPWFRSGLLGERACRSFRAAVHSYHTLHIRVGGAQGCCNSALHHLALRGAARLGRVSFRAIGLYG